MPARPKPRAATLTAAPATARWSWVLPALKRLTLAILLMAAVFVALNWPYFQRLGAYYLNPPSAEDLEVQLPQAGTRVEPNRLRIKALGIEAPIVYTEASDEDGFQVSLRTGVVHYPGTALPGQAGNAYLFGHSSDYLTAPGDYKTVFALLPQAQVGDMIEISDPDGRLFVYSVTETAVISPDDFSRLSQDRTRRQLTLQTSYPIGTALKRFIVVAEIVD